MFTVSVWLYLDNGVICHTELRSCVWGKSVSGEMGSSDIDVRREKKLKEGSEGAVRQKKIRRRRTETEHEGG